MKTQKSTVPIGILTVLVVFGLLFAACGDPDGGPAHTHQWGEWTVTTEPTCTTAGEKERTCSLDGTVEKQAIPVDMVNGHDYQYVPDSGTAPTCEEDGEGDEVCSHNPSHKRIGVVISKLGHDYVWEVTTPATCTDEGEETGTCSHDGSHTTTLSIPIDEDAHDWEQLEGTPPTCTETGSGKRRCRICGIEETLETIPALGHDDGEWHTTLAATCTTTGTRELRCTKDQTVLETGIIAALGHDWEWVTPPNFISAGVITRRCKHDSSHTENFNCPFPITTGEEWTTALSQLNGKTGEYTLTIDGDIDVAGKSYTNSFGGYTANGSSLIVTLKGTGKLYLTSQGNIISIGANQTLIIDSEDLTLQGLTDGENGATQDNNDSVVYVNSNGRLELQNGTISGNTLTSERGGGVNVSGVNATFTMNGGEISNNSGCGGVYVNYGTFTMDGGEISNNSDSGVVVANRGVFIMKDGEISGNNASFGGGVEVSDSNTIFTMQGGKISNNTANNSGGGVYYNGNETFTMQGGEISGNSTYSGGGVYVGNDKTFTMEDGKIFNNTGIVGGGVYVGNRGTFTMIDGVISNNTATEGGGVTLNSNSIFTMRNGVISNNTATTKGGGVMVYTGTFTMNGGKISDNTATNGGGVYVYYATNTVRGTFRIVTGTIYGSNEVDENLRNTATSGAALYKDTNGIAEYGTFSGEEWIKAENGDLVTTNNTIRVVEGVWIQ